MSKPISTAPALSHGTQSAIGCTAFDSVIADALTMGAAEQNRPRGPQVERPRAGLVPARPTAAGVPCRRACGVANEMAAPTRKRGSNYLICLCFCRRDWIA